MQIVIDIPDRLIKKVKDHYVNPYEVDEICEAILDGTPLPKGHGRLIDADALFDYFGNDALDEVTRSNIEYFIRETKATIIEADIPTMYYPQVEGITPIIIEADTESEDKE